MLPWGVSDLPPLAELAWWCLTLCAIQLFPIRSSSGLRLGVDPPVWLAAAFVFGPAVGAAVTAIAYSDPAEWTGVVTLSRAACNRFMRGLSAASAGIVFHALGGFTLAWPLLLAAGLVAVVVGMVANYGLGALLVHRLTRAGPLTALWQTRKGPFPGFLLSYVAFGCIAVPMAAFYQRVGSWTLVVFLIPALLVRQTVSHAQQLDDAKRSLAEKDRAVRRVSSQVVRERSDERLRIASALHDDVLQRLHFLTLHAQVIREDLRQGNLLQLEDDIPLFLEKSQEMAEVCRSVISGLRSSSLGLEGVAPALADLVREIADGCEGTVVLDIQAVAGDPRLHDAVYQIGREAITNAVKHSGAENIWISLQEEPGVVRLVVSDDGCGFDPSTGGRSDHFGMWLMQEQATAAGGTVEVGSTPGQGTCVTALFAPPAEDL